jgi:hypothetical protein
VELRWTVALEAALFFSLPCSIMTVDPAWPADDPWQFARFVLVGASVAALLCHLIAAVIWDSASRSWLWSIVIASAALGALHLLIRVRQALSKRFS